MRTSLSLKTAIIAIITLTISATNAHADDYFKHGGIRYKIESFIDQELRVTYPEESDYSTTELVIPATIKTKQGQVWTVTAIGENAFTRFSMDCGYKNLRKVTIPKTVTTIHKFAFRESDIEEITADCPIELHAAEQLIDGRHVATTNKGKWLKVVNLGPNATKVTCKKLTETLWDKYWIKKVTLNPANKNLTMVDGVLYDKGKTEMLYFPRDKEFVYRMPSTLKIIPKYAMKYSNITGVILNNTLTKVDEDMFYDCEKLQTITIPPSVNEIGVDAFMFCKGLKSVNLSEGLKTIGRRAFANCDNLESITIPKSVTNMSSDAFHSSGLRSFTIPPCVTEIGFQALSRCPHLEKLIIYETLKNVHDEAVIYSKELKYIYCYAKSPQFKFPFFSDYGYRYTVKEIHVPQGCKVAYENSDWKRNGITIIDDL